MRNIIDQDDGKLDFFKESVNKTYDGSDPNSLAAWLHIDISKHEGRVHVCDTYGDFEWDQSKSNANVRRESETGSGEGKGFSFYFARYAYSDPYSYEDESLSTGDPSYSGNLAAIRGPFINKVLKGQGYPKDILEPTRAVLLVIDVKETTPKAIISATFTKNKKLVKLYSAHWSEETMKRLALDEGYTLKEYIENPDPLHDQKLEALTDLKIKSIMDGIAEFEKFIRENQ